MPTCPLGAQLYVTRTVGNECSISSRDTSPTTDGVEGDPCSAVAGVEQGSGHLGAENVSPGDRSVSQVGGTMLANDLSGKGLPPRLIRSPAVSGEDFGPVRLREGSPMHGGALDAFYRDLIWELGEHARKGGTAIGAAAVVKRVGVAHGIAAAGRVPLPRWSRSEFEALKASAWERSQ